LEQTVVDRIEEKKDENPIVTEWIITDFLSFAVRVKSGSSKVPKKKEIKF